MANMEYIKEIENIIFQDFEDFFEFSSDAEFQKYLHDRDFWGCFHFMKNSFCNICFVGLMENITFKMWVNYIEYQYYYFDSFEEIEDFHCCIGEIAAYLYQ